MSIWRGYPEIDFGSDGRINLGADVSLAAAYGFANESDVLEYHKGGLGKHRYGRDSTPTAEFVERWLSNLYDKPAFLFPSGMAAIAAALQFAPAGSRHIFLTRENYRKTRSLAHREATAVSHFTGASDLRKQMQDCGCDGRVLLVESPANPHLRIVNLPVLAEVASEFGALRVWDATFAGLDNVTTAYDVFDLVVHSATKYISGHDDVIAGVLFARETVSQQVFDLRSQFSSVLDPMSSFLLSRSLATYDMRVKQMLRNTAEVLGVLSEQADTGCVEKIWYPGRFENSDQADVADATMQHKGSVVSFTVSPEVAPNFRDASRLRFARLAPSFGSVKTLFEVPATMSHGSKPIQEVEQSGIERNLVRFSVGVEPIEGIIEDLIRLVTPASV